MGYYVEVANGPITQSEWNGIIEKFKTVLPHLGCKVCGPDGAGEPIIDSDTISFNGDANCTGIAGGRCNHVRGSNGSWGDTCASPNAFTVHRSGGGMLVKPNCRPYVAAIKALLIIIDDTINARLLVKQEYPIDEWQDVIGICSNVVGVNLDISDAAVLRRFDLTDTMADEHGQDCTLCHTPIFDGQKTVGTTTHAGCAAVKEKRKKRGLCTHCGKRKRKTTLVRSGPQDCMPLKVKPRPDTCWTCDKYDLLPEGYPIP